MANTTTSRGLRLDIRMPDDSDAVRDRGSRWLVLIGATALAVLVPVYFGTLWGSFIGAPGFGLLVGLGGAATLTIALYIRSLVSNPEWAGYVTLNPLNGKNIPYGPGYHPTFFWEQRNKNGNYPLKVITKTFEIPVQTMTSQVIANGIFEYQVDLVNIVNNVGIDESTVDAGYNGFIDNFLTVNLAPRTAEEARMQVNLVNEQLENEFMGVVSTATGETVQEFETKNGIRTVAIALTGLRLPPAVQKTRDAVDEGRKIFEIMAAIKGVTPDELRAMIIDARVTKQEEAELRRAALAASENAEMKIFEGNMASLGAVGEVIGGAQNGNRSTR